MSEHDHASSATERKPAPSRRDRSERQGEAVDRSRGEPLTPSVLRAFSGVLGNLDDVRVHTSYDDAARVRSLDARAVTIGRSILFDADQYRPDTAAGRTLLGHELVHAAQPPAPASFAPVVATREHSAEREAHTFRGDRAPTAARAGIHLFDRAEGLREGETLPAPLLFAVAGDRFLVRTDLNAARELSFVIHVQGDLPVEATTMTDRTVVLTVLDVTRPVVAELLELQHEGFAIDLYGDGTEIIWLVDRAEPGRFGDTRDHQWRVLRNSEPARRNDTPVESVIHVRLPPPPRNISLGEGGAGTSERVVSALYSNYGDAFQISVRRFGTTGLVAVHISSAIFADPVGSSPTTLVRLSAPPERLTIAYVRREGRVVEIDLNGDGLTDLRYDHTVSEWTVGPGDPREGYRVRNHRFDAFNSGGEMLGRVNRHPIYHDLIGTTYLPPIPAEGRAIADETDIGAPLPDTAPPAQGDTPGEFSGWAERSGGVIETRVDGDGDRRKELLFRFRPAGECSSDGGQRVTVQIIQISSMLMVTTELNLDSDQFSLMRPLVTEPADSVNTAIIDVVNRFAGDVAPNRLTIEIDPPRHEVVVPTVDTFETVYPMRIAGQPLDVRFPYEESEAAPLLAGNIANVRFADMWVVDLTLGEYGDRFRLTFSDDLVGGTLGISAMDENRPGETRAIGLVADAAEHQPVLAESHPQQVMFRLGDYDLFLSDALSSPVGTDVQVDRTHRITLCGSALRDTRTIRFDYHEGSFAWDSRGMDLPTYGMRGVLGRVQEEQYDSMFDWGNLLAPAIRAGVDRAHVSDRAYDTFRDAHVAMLRVRWESAQTEAAEHRERLITQGDEFLGAMIEAEPAAVDPQMNTARASYRIRAWDTAFQQYITGLQTYHDTLGEGARTDATQRDVAIRASGVDVMRNLLAEGSSFSAIRARLEAAAGTEVVSAHELGLINDEFFQHWDTLRRNMPLLRAVAAEEATYDECIADPRIELAAAAGRGLHREICAASRTASDHASYTGEHYDYSRRWYSGGYGIWLAESLESGNWDNAFSNYDNLMRSTDRWITHALEERVAATTGDERRTWQQRLDNNKYVSRMRAELGELASIPDVIPVAATFVPDTSYANQQGYIPAIPIRVFVWHDGDDWQLRDLTNPESKYETSAGGDRASGPPDELFQDLNDRDRFPKGILYYQMPDGGIGGQVICTAEKEWHDWLRDIGLAVAAIGLILATFGTGTVAVVGGYFLAGAAIMNAVAATGDLIDSVRHGHATTTSVILNVLDIVASLAGAGSLISGTIVRSATQAARTGMAWTGAAARVAAFADRAYVPLTATSMGADVASAAVMTHDTIQQLNELSSLPPDQADEARRALLIQLAITGGLTVMSVKGDLPEIRAGRRNIVLDVVGDVAVARAAGVRLDDVDLDIAATDARSHAAARWHATEDVLPPPSTVSEEDAAMWRREWLEQDHRVTFGPDGAPQVQVPPGAPPEVQDWLRSMAGPDSAIVRAERAFSVGDDMARLEAASPGLRVDPLDPSWATSTRQQVVSRLGGGPDAEAIVARFEAARLGSLSSSPEFAASHARVNRLLPDNELERTSDLFGGYEVYMTGSPLSEASPAGSIDRVELVVSVPGDITPDMMAAIEQRGQLLRLRPDPEFLRANGLEPGHTIGVDVRVVPRGSVIGLSAAGVPLHRIDNAAATRALELDSVMAGHLTGMGLNPDTLPYRVEVMKNEDFAAEFSSARGRTVFQLEDGRAVIYARADATRLDMLDEASHLAQALDDTLERQIRTLSGANFDDWAMQPAQFRFEMFSTKLHLEIDAKYRSLRALEADRTALPSDLEEIRGQLQDLIRLRAHAESITPEQLSLMNAGVIPVPSYLETPPWLFGKRTIFGVAGLAPIEIPRNAPRTPVPGRPDPNYSTAADDIENVRAVRQIGSSWRERTQIYSGFEGRVIEVTVDGATTTVTVARPSGGQQVYVVEGGALDPAIHVGATVRNGQTIGDEAAREYRRVEIEDNSGRITTREEIRRLTPGGGWIQRGSDSTARGAIMEAAARRQVDIALEAARASGTIESFHHLPHSRAGGGFDDVVVEFSPNFVTVSGWTARVRVREVKDYPNRSVPLAEFTAIRREGGGLEANLTILRNDVSAAVQGRLAGLPGPEPYASMTDEQLEALEAAVWGRGIEIEVVIGPTTRLGAEGAPHASVLEDLRTEINDVMHYDALVRRPETDGVQDAPERVLQELADEAAIEHGRGL